MKTDTDATIVRAPIRGLRIRARVFLAAASLVVFVVGVAVAVATWRANQVAERTIRNDLGKVTQVFTGFRENVELLLREKLRSIAEEPGTKSLFAAADTPTRWEFARDIAELHGAQTVFLFDATSAVLARSDRAVGEGVGQPFARVQWVADVLDTMRPSSAAIREGETLCLVASVPVFAGVGSTRILTGVLAASFPLDAARTRQLQAVTRGEVGFLSDVSRRDEPPRLVVSSATTGLGGQEFLDAFTALADLPESLFAPGKPESIGPLDLAVDGEQRLVIAHPVRSASGEALGALVVSRSRDQETAAFREIRNTFLAVGLTALLAAIPMSFALGRGIARPIEQLAHGAEAVRHGNLSVSLPETGSGEVGALSRAFSEMVAELREKAALEDLVVDLQLRPGQPTTDPTDTGRPARVVPRGILPQVGQVIGGRYRIESLLSRGGMGAVYLVQDQELEEQVALKVLDVRQVPEGTNAAQTLKQEIRLARKITHPNVVRVHDLGEADGVSFVTMEYVPGMTLREMVDRGGAVALSPGLQIAKQILRGLAAVHEAGILHRDIKPHNIMVLPSGVVKLMDFGISRIAGGDDALEELIVGTPAYMSPEQALGGDLDSRTDIYSVGTVIFELFTGTKAFRGAGSTAAFTERLDAPPPEPLELRSDLPEGLAALIRSCLAGRRDDRPASATEVYNALMRITA